jgi:hypothetical protein
VLQEDFREDAGRGGTHCKAFILDNFVVFMLFLLFSYFYINILTVGYLGQERQQISSIAPACL